MTWTYYSVFFAQDGRSEEPLFLVRLRPGDSIAAAERLDPSGLWLWTSALLEIDRDGCFTEAEEISHSQARAFAHTSLVAGTLPEIPQDLA